MGLLGDFAAYIDNLKRRGMNTAKDLASDPMGLLGRNISALSESLPAAPGEPPNEMLARPGMQDWATGVALNAPTMGLLGHTVYHGSPHKFDKFDASKIGTGEGAQAYGHGIYLAESKKVADEYAGKLSAKSVGINGYKPTDEAQKILDRLSARANTTQYKSAKSAVWDDLQSIIRHGSPAEQAAAKEIEQRAGFLGQKLQVFDEGNLYKVDLPDEWLPKMLDWDKPLSEQPEAVRMALAADRRAKDSLYGSGAEYYRGVGSRSAQNAPPHVSADRADELAQRDATEYLKSLGIPGIRYKDQVSRGKEGGTYNYVVFPGMEHLLKILERE